MRGAPDARGGESSRPLGDKVKREPWLVVTSLGERTLVAAAERLAGQGHGRSALAEAVTALEVALYAFARDPAVDSALTSALAQRKAYDPTSAIGQRQSAVRDC